MEFQKSELELQTYDMSSFKALQMTSTNPKAPDPTVTAIDAETSADIFEKVLFLYNKIKISEKYQFSL